LPTVVLKNAEAVKTNTEKVVKIGFDAQNPEAIVLVEKQIGITLSESNFDKESAFAKRNVIARERPRYSADPGLAQKRALVQAAAARYGIDWKILEAVWQVESGKSWDTSKTSYAGATGPMQFLPSTFRKYAVDGNSDGVVSIYSAHDSVYAGANLLASAGAATGAVERALFAYNHSYSYVKKVLRIARSIGY
jgi:membrane-bound lytic murein transglycosylase B